MTPIFNLPSEITQQIFEFCGDKRLAWDKLNQQFLKGGFNRKNLQLIKYLQKEKWYAKKFWASTRPEISGAITQWNIVTKKREICLFDYQHGEWNIKNKAVRVTFKTNYGERNRWSAKESVSKWLNNIKKFETSYPEFARNTYLPNTTPPINIKRNSKFYIDLRSRNKKKRKREKVKKEASLFMEERKQLKLKKCNFKKNQELLLSFTMSSGKLKFYRGRVHQIYLRQHRGVILRQLIFPAPRCANRFDPLKIDCYIGEVKISVRFEDNEIRQYTSEKLTERVKTSAKEKFAQEKIISLN